MPPSILTLVRGREQHLRNLMESLAHQTVQPLELVIAWMQDEPFANLPKLDCPVRHIFVAGEPMPLAKARNAAAVAALGDTLIFLDVDCIASPTLVEAFTNAAAREDGVFLGEVLYLPAGVANTGVDYALFDQQGVRHPAKPAPPETGICAEPDHGELWGLSFAIRAATWRALGGMDEAYVGYGGEETDFAAKLKENGIPLYWTGHARAYHQHHAVLSPPVHQFDHIIRNAELFHARHGRWCMDYWLGQFQALDLIDWTKDTARIEVKRRPTAHDIEAARQPDTALFS
ncbi:glycosyltransferase [Rhizobium sp. CFBP 8762]|uniref:glycosyltransferase family 2 protein n=1 Tax=Rhizobium sp. CFBP 8762 TaxID=2775279 RepID=UPI00177CA7EE|nr:galactosyltransferase-related protein [Rhizobium sp. CFBP 8762]MBD8554362.1 glycosyltransferase [Rhizobium sp. CFBP 8762]